MSRQPEPLSPLDDNDPTPRTIREATTQRPPGMSLANYLKTVEGIAEYQGRVIYFQEVANQWYARPFLTYYNGSYYSTGGMKTYAVAERPAYVLPLDAYCVRYGRYAPCQVLVPYDSPFCIDRGSARACIEENGDVWVDAILYLVMASQGNHRYHCSIYQLNTSVAASFGGCRVSFNDVKSKTEYENIGSGPVTVRATP